MTSAANLKSDYHIGIITALPIERAAITAMLDAIYDEPDDFDQSSHDPNSYTWGRMGLHNVVIASLAAGVYGNTMATTTAMPMLYSFANIKFGLMVGIGAGIPTSFDVRLGDVVVSQPSGISGGVFQYDLGKAKHNDWERTDFLARPPDILLKALNRLQTEHEFRIPQAYEHLRTAITKHEYWGQSYSRPSTDDHLFPSSYLHLADSFGNTCSACDPIKAIKRTRRPLLMEFKIHYGVIASGNSLVKDAKLRDWIASMDKQCVCIEMEAAGLMNNFPCLVIRGICDYADSHKNDAWQRYACATAAAFSKELLSFVPLTDSRTATKATKVLQDPNSKPIASPIHARNGSEQAKLDKASPNLPSDDSAGFTLLSSSTSAPGSTSPGMSLDEEDTLENSATGLGKAGASFFSRYPLPKREEINATLGERRETLLHLAAREGAVEVAAWLIQCGADIEAKNKWGETPLYIAAETGRLNVAKLLIEHKADIDAVVPGGGMLLYYAVLYGDLDMVRLLLRKGVNINGRPWHKTTALDMARALGHKEIVELLESHELGGEQQKSSI